MPDARASSAVPALPLLGILLLAALLPGCGASDRGESFTVAEVGKTAPDFELEAVGSDETIQLSSYRGERPVVLNFFCGCHYCYEVAHAWREAGDQLGDAQMLAIMHNRDTFSPVHVRDFREATEFEAPILADVSSTTALQYRSVDCPMTWVIDKKGVVSYRNKERTQPAKEIVGGALDALKGL